MDDSLSSPPHVSRIHIPSDLKSDLERLIQAVGGWEWLHTGDTVLVKPNYNSAHPPPGSVAIDFLRAASRGLGISHG